MRLMKPCARRRRDAPSASPRAHSDVTFRTLAQKGIAFTVFGLVPQSSFCRAVDAERCITSDYCARTSRYMNGNAIWPATEVVSLIPPHWPGSLY